jgi:signal transduction histidine kinase
VPVRWPIRNQILAPFATLLVVAVAATTLAAAWLAGRRIEGRTVDHLDRVIDTLTDDEHGRFPLTRNVLAKMQGLSGAEFLVLDDGGARGPGTIDPTADALDAATIAAATVPPATGAIGSLRDRPTIAVDGARYHVAAIPQRDVTGRPLTLVALYPAAALEQARWEAMLPPLVTGAGLLLAMVLTAAWLAGRTARRIHDVRERVARVADGDFEAIDLAGPDDEVRDLALSVNRMATRLRELQERMTQGERARLLGQLAGGLAHQLRNAATGARLALQLHLRRHANDSNGDGNGEATRENEGLDVALRQLLLVEEQVKALLSLGSEDQRALVPGTAGAIVDEVAHLVRATCEHENVTFDVDGEEADRAADVGDAEGVRSALLNLVLNAIEAAGPGGDVLVVPAVDDGRLRFDVYDSGPGPATDLGDGVFEPFVTTKPEGVGLGLALVRRIADRNGGEVGWTREEGPTRFRLSLPLTNGRG